MRKRVFRHRILWGCVAVLLIAASIVAIVYFVNAGKAKGKVAEEKVVRASLSSSLSSAGEIQTVATKVRVPLAAVTVEDPETLSGIEENDYAVNILTLLGENSSEPLLWRVLEVNEAYAKRTSTFSTDDEGEMLLRIAPVSFDWEAVARHYQLELVAGTTEAESVKEYMLTLLLRTGSSSVDPAVFPDEFWRTDEAAAVTVGTAGIGELLLSEVPYVESLHFEIENLVANEGDILLLDSHLFTVSYEERFVGLVLSEYDVAGIDARMRGGERVYANVAVNALGGHELLAEIVKIGSPTSSSGVTYYTLLGRLVFPEIKKEPDGSEKGSYTYYDPEFLTDDNVRYLGIDPSVNVREEELLERYSVTVTAQKTVVKDTLIVPTKCIYYDDSRKPYVVKLMDDGTEKRVFIRIDLSTGTDAAVTPLEEGMLDEGDILRYTAESSLIGSLF